VPICRKSFIEILTNKRRFVLTEEFIDSLCKLGLTNNQARVYLTIASKTKIKVPEIANLTGIHEQDIYKILPKLEQTGLITKSTTKPLILEALAPEVVLIKLIKKQRENLDRAEKNTQEFIKALKCKKAVYNQKEYEEKATIFNTYSQSCRNNAFLAFSRAKKSFDVIGEKDSTNLFLKLALPQLKEHMHIFEKYRVKVRMLSQYITNENCPSDINLKQFSTLDIQIKQVRLGTDAALPFLNYFIIDGKEVVAGTTGPFEAMVTDCMPIVRLAQEHFEKSWQDNNTELIFSSKPTNDLPVKVAPNSN